MSSFLNRLRAWDRWEPPVQGWGEIVKVVNAPEPVSLSECAAEIERLNAENARLREALEKIAALDVPPSVMTRYREDGQPSEDDLCPHLLPMSEDCPDCIADYARAALAGEEK